jgi:hypothetical protein
MTDIDQKYQCTACGAVYIEDEMLVGGCTSGRPSGKVCPNCSQWDDRPNTVMRWIPFDARP